MEREKLTGELIAEKKRMLLSQKGKV